MIIVKLVASLNTACKLALAHHHFKVVGKNPALVVTFDEKESAEIVYINDTNNVVKPAGIKTWALVLRRSDLLDIVNSVAGLNLEPEQAAQKLTRLILSQLNWIIYRGEPKCDSVVELAKLMDECCVRGICSHAIGQAAQRTNSKPELN